MNAEDQPYIQHRGGPPSFLKVIDERTLGFADFSGNRQYITVGNLNDNPKALNFANRRRIKICGRAEVMEDDADLRELGREVDVGNEARREWPDQRPGDEIAHERRHAQPVGDGAENEGQHQARDDR